MTGPETIELEIRDVAYGGRGIGRHEGWAVFVPGALPGETVRAGIVRRHKRYADAELLEIVVPSPDRITPGCPLADARLPPESRCAGCCYQHVAYAAELKLKHKQLVDLLARIGRVDQPVVETVTGSPLTSGYRNKIVLHVAERGGRTALGYVAADNHSVLDIEACPLAQPELNARLAAIRANRPAELNDAESLTLRSTATDGAAHWFGRAAGQERLTESTPLGNIDVPRRCFFQVNPSALDLLLEEVTQPIRTLKPRCVVDLYCGVGLFAIAAARAGVPAVWGIDSDTRAIRAAKRNAAAGNLNIRFLGATTALALPELAPALHAGHTMAIVDPPRKGLESGVVEGLAALPVYHVVYVSCAPDTLSRDVARLAAQGYRLVRTRLLDMFPRTASFESLSVLQRT